MPCTMVGTAPDSAVMVIAVAMVNPLWNVERIPRTTPMVFRLSFSLHVQRIMLAIVSAAKP